VLREYLEKQEAVKALVRTEKHISRARRKHLQGPGHLPNLLVGDLAAFAGRRGAGIRS
jgi:hypothetical protein